MHVYYEGRKTDRAILGRIKKDVKDISDKIKGKLIEGISEMGIQNWAKIELLIELGALRDKNIQKKFADEISKMDIPNWAKIKLLMKIGVPQDEDTYYRYERMFLYGLHTEGYSEHTVTEELGFNPLEAFLYKLYKLIDLAESNGNEGVVRNLEEMKESVLARGDFTFEDCLELMKLGKELG